MARMPQQQPSVLVQLAAILTRRLEAQPGGSGPQHMASASRVLTTYFRRGTLMCCPHLPRAGSPADIPTTTSIPSALATSWTDIIVQTVVGARSYRSSHYVIRNFPELFTRFLEMFSLQNNRNFSENKISCFRHTQNDWHRWITLLLILTMEGAESRQSDNSL
jgi:hypothetical protein